MASAKRVCVVTGANKGIGFAIMKEMCAKFDGVVYLTSRDEKRGRDSQEELKKLGFQSNYHQLDIDNEESIIKFKDYLKKTYGGLDVLVNNAAMAYKNAATEPIGEQAENTIRVNVFGTMNVCKHLFPLLRPFARVSHVSSAVGHHKFFKGKDPENAQLLKRFSSKTLTEGQLVELCNEFVESAKDGTHAEKGWPNSTYCVSKVAVNALTMIQQRAFDADPREDLVVNSCHPGYVDTDMSSHKGPMSIEEGAVAPSWLALLPPKVKEPRGGFVWSKKEIVSWYDGEAPNHF